MPLAVARRGEPFYEPVYTLWYSSAKAKEAEAAARRTCTECVPRFCGTEDWT
ncbi:hypothetical protein HPL003_07705 [Paenibacillus terrae HPL-003]|uniref:Uncharacterized protein n=1 Tax=Paenibacillus terrae (strain HPL-003) TaxID=985665 RepID=G7VVV2_PAETH|nr:hypothetical protein HPL003_07705 [Paenibacillus terrae HPL-003]